jgi:uncharacterized membrane protein YebE (DUF533 family)
MKIESVLAELHVPREAYRVIMLMPLVYVAWADGRIQAEERRLILHIAAERGLLENGGRACLERWLAVAPTADQLKSHLAILNELARSDRNALGRDMDADAEQLLIAWCQDVADAAGGLLGLLSPRKESEEAALKTIVAAIDIGRAKNWRAFVGQG